MKSISFYLSLCLFVLLTLLSTGCRTYDNFTTYFNTYYNAQRLLKESEDEFEFSAVAIKKQPRTLVPLDSGVQFGGQAPRNEMAPFIKDYVIDKSRIQPVQTKLDSVLIKGSKILQRHPKSNFVEGSLYLMAKSYYYKNDWMNAEIKCSELVDLYPFGDLSPDAHLLMAQAYFIERKYMLGEQALSRCIDISWYKERYDILAEAFKFSAEHAIYQNDVDKAVRPYKQAIAITESGALQSKWHLELGSIYYRLSRWEEAEKEFKQVGDFDVDLLGEYEARLFRVSSLVHLKRYEEAQEILDAMAKNENYKDWEGALLAEQMRLYRLSGKDSLFIDSEKKADTYTGNPNIAALYFERGMEYYKKNDYVKSRIYFAKCRGAKSPVSRAANEYYTLLNDIETHNIELNKFNELKRKNVPLNDTSKTLAAGRYFSLARSFEKLGKRDSAYKYYLKAADSCPVKSPERAQFLYGVQRMYRDSFPDKADSLVEIIALEYGRTEFGKEARQKLGFTEIAEIDTAMDYYNSGSRFRLIGNDTLAIRQFKKVFEKYPKSNVAPRALYAVGWLFERKLFLMDSAIFYYRKLVKDYPMTEYSNDVLSSLNSLDTKNIPPRPDANKPETGQTITVKQDSISQNINNQVSFPDNQESPTNTIDIKKNDSPVSLPSGFPSSIKDAIKLDVPTELPSLKDLNPFKSKSDTTESKSPLDVLKELNPFKSKVDSIKSKIDSLPPKKKP